MAIGIYNGYLFDFIDPDPALIDLDTIAVVLDRMPRFGGHTTRVITVAEHSLRVRRIARDLACKLGSWDPADLEMVELHALLHDAHEVYTPWGDCLAPGKTAIMREVETRIDLAIYKSLELREPTDETMAIVHQADQAALYWEATLWCPSAHRWVPWLPGRPDEVVQAEHTAQLVIPTPGECWLTEVQSLRARPGMRR